MQFQEWCCEGHRNALVDKNNRTCSCLIDLSPTTSESEIRHLVKFLFICCVPVGSLPEIGSEIHISHHRLVDGIRQAKVSFHESEGRTGAEQVAKCSIACKVLCKRLHRWSFCHVESLQTNQFCSRKWSSISRSEWHPTFLRILFSFFCFFFCFVFNSSLTNSICVVWLLKPTFSTSNVHCSIVFSVGKQIQIKIYLDSLCDYWKCRNAY